MAKIRLFATVRVAAGTGSDTIEGETVDQVVDAAKAKYGPDFASALQTCRIWVNGEPAELPDSVGPNDEIAFLPPVSGG